ncbi:MAG: alpha/beta fold hydrolase [Myxococcota bacterium]
MSNPAIQPPPLNVLFPTLGGKQLWADEFVCEGWRIQQNVVSGHHRLLDDADLRIAWGTWEHCKAHFDRIAAQRGFVKPDRHLVLLLHGIFRSKDSFGPMTRALRRAGYEAEAVNYPSTRRSLEEHAEQIERILDRARHVSRVSFVCHSMGGIVARVLLGRQGAWRQRIQAHRLVMIATPNRGAEIAEHVWSTGALAKLTSGPALRQLHRDRIGEVPLPDIPFATIAGSRGTPEGFNPLLPGDDDMTVTVESTRLEGAEDELVVRATHTFVMIKPEVVVAVLRYLKTGRFHFEDDGLPEDP